MISYSIRIRARLRISVDACFRSLLTAFPISVVWQRKNYVNPVLIKNYLKKQQPKNNCCQDKWQANAITKGKIVIKPSEYLQLEPSTEASSTSQTILNQTITTLANEPQIRNQKTQPPKGLSIQQSD
jgi:hypothetical protein